MMANAHLGTATTVPGGLMANENLGTTTTVPGGIIRIECLTKQGYHSTRFLGECTNLIKDLVKQAFCVPSVRHVRVQIEAWKVRHVIWAYADGDDCGADDDGHLAKTKTPIGVVLIGEREEGKRYKIHALCVAPEFKGRGIGTRLMHHAVAKLPVDAEEVEICVDHLPWDMEKEERLLRWYEGMGFENQGLQTTKQEYRLVASGRALMGKLPLTTV